MNENLRFGKLSRSFTVFAVAGLACTAVACTTQEVKGPGTGGSTGSVAGHNGTAGTTGAGGSGTVAACGTGPFAPTAGVLCPLPTQMITNFTYDADAGDTTQVRFGTVGTTLSGGEFSYSNAPGTVTADVTQNDWHISGNVANYSGFNIYFDVIGGCNMIDASAFDGISFTIWGTAGATALTDNKITMGVGTVEDSVTPSWLASVDAGSATPSPGSCIPTSGNGPYYHPGCGDPMNVFGVTGTRASPQTVALHWATDFPLGLCKPHVSPEQILTIYWQLPWTPGQAPYDVDLHIDDLQFIAKP